MNLGAIIEELSDKEFPFQIRIECEGRENLPLDVLEDFQGKLKNRTESDIIKILRSIRDYGFSFPFFYWRSGDTRYVLDGHGRLLALQIFRQLGGQIPSLPACRVVAKDEADAKQKLLRLNSRYGTIDLERLKDFVDGLEINVDDLELPDISVDDLEDIFSDSENTETEADDELPEDVPEISKLGDLWELDSHRVLCGDSTDAEQVERLMAEQKADMVFTDPPYGVDYDGGTKVRTKLAGDSSTSLYDPACKISAEFSNKKAALYLWHAGVKGIAAAAAAAAAAAGYSIRCELIWNKNQAQYGALSAQYKQKHEPCYYCNKRGKAPYWFGPTNEITVWDCDRSIANEFHPTQKPVELAERALRNSSKINFIIADWFLGSGSTLIACEKTDRICYGMEIEPHYVDVTVRRWVDWCGQNDRTPTIKLNGKQFSLTRLDAA